MALEAVIFDTEFTAWRGSVERNWRGPGEGREIVQIGAVALDAGSLREIGSFSVLIKPVRNPVLSDYLVELTRITNERLAAEGTDFAAGVRAFLAFVGNRPISCYGRDDRVIKANAEVLGLRDLWPSSLAASNLKDWLEQIGVPLAGVNSGALAQHVGAASQGLAHDAVVDSRSLAEAIRYLVARGAPNPLLAQWERAGPA